MDEKLLLRFLTHSCSNEELKQIDAWIASSKTNADWLFAMEHIWSLKDELRFSDKQEIEEAYKKFINKIDKKTNKKKYRIYPILKYAAAIIIISLLSINLYKMFSPQQGSEALNEIYVPRGERAFVTLSDGTKVSLNADTKFTYPGSFSKDSRNVTLSGEGYFEVAHNAKKPFIVNTKSINVRVLGTKFNMSTYSGENSTVTLAEGKVEVESSDKENKLIIHPNEEISYSETSGMTIVNVDPAVAKSWINGELAYVNKTLYDICKGIERKYNVEITIVDKELASEIFTCHFTSSASIKEVMDLLKETRRLDYSIKEEKIQIINPQNI